MMFSIRMHINLWHPDYAISLQSELYWLWASGKSYSKRIAYQTYTAFPEKIRLPSLETCLKGIMCPRLVLLSIIHHDDDDAWYKNGENIINGLLGIKP